MRLLFPFIHMNFLYITTNVELEVNQLEVQNESRPIVYDYFRFYSKSIVERLSEAEQESHLSSQKLRVSEHKHF